MAVLRTPDATTALGNPSLDNTVAIAPARAQARGYARVRNAVALLVYSTGYPLLALALWVGARDGSWTRASAFVALGVCTSFIGWALVCVADQVRDGREFLEGERRPVASREYLSLYNRAGAIVILIGSYAVAAQAQGWPTPQTFVGWFALVWVPLFVCIAIPVGSASRASESLESSD